MKNATTVNSHVNDQITASTGAALLQIAFRVSLVLTVCFIGLVGIWGVACLVGGAVSAGGPFDLLQGWFSAVTGG